MGAEEQAGVGSDPPVPIGGVFDVSAGVVDEGGGVEPGAVVGFVPDDEVNDGRVPVGEEGDEVVPGALIEQGGTRGLAEGGTAEAPGVDVEGWGAPKDDEALQAVEGVLCEACVERFDDDFVVAAGGLDLEARRFCGVGGPSQGTGAGAELDGGFLEAGPPEVGFMDGGLDEACDGLQA